MYEFQVAKAPYLVAVGDGQRLVVYRSEFVPTDAPAYQEVLDYVIDNRMHVVETDTTTHTNMVGLLTYTQWKRSPDE